MQAFVESLSSAQFLANVQVDAVIDLGQLHPLAMCSMIQPGSLGGQTFTALLFPLNELLALPGKNPGLFITQQRLRSTKRKWGFNPSLMGDTYTNYGLPGFVIVFPLFGLALKWVYVRFRTGRLPAAIYGLAAFYAGRLFLDCIDKWPEALLVILSAATAIKIGRFIGQAAGRSV